jgi:formylglycine-generating enzyme required for sulfatase activity
MLETIARVGYRLVEVTPILDEPLANACPVASATASGHSGKAPWRAWPHWTAVAAAFAIAAVAAIAGFASGFLSRHASIEIARTIFPQSAAIAHVSYNGPPDGTSFRDCSEGCPEMIVIPPGRFLMGAAYGEHGHSGHESPQHVVTIRYHFAVAKYDVTREEYALFASETNRPDGNDHCFTLIRSGRFLETPNASWRDPGFRQTSRDPAVCISWDDAEAYADWLARKTGKPYRLLTEAEWEYAARAGSTSAQPDVPSRLCRAFNGGDADYHARFSGDAAADDECHDGYAQTSPVGRFPPNAFGLFDMLGNAGQWVSDCYNQTYDGAPGDGSAWTDANCGMHVARGGSWTNDSRDIRFALRLGSYAVGRFSTNGLRVARKM